jgi:hypothetical protein
MVLLRAGPDSWRFDPSYLTVEQAMADYTAALSNLTASWGAADSAVVAFGGSYGGMLAAWMRRCGRAARARMHAGVCAAHDADVALCPLLHPRHVGGTRTSSLARWRRQRPLVSSLAWMALTPRPSGRCVRGGAHATQSAVLLQPAPALQPALTPAHASCRPPAFVTRTLGPLSSHKVVTRDATPAAGAAAGCDDAVRQAFVDLRAAGTTPEGRAQLSTTFSLCSHLQDAEQALQLAFWAQVRRMHTDTVDQGSVHRATCVHDRARRLHACKGCVCVCVCLHRTGRL